NQSHQLLNIQNIILITKSSSAFVRNCSLSKIIRKQFILVFSTLHTHNKKTDRFTSQFAGKIIVATKRADESVTIILNYATLSSFNDFFLFRRPVFFLAA